MCGQTLLFIVIANCAIDVTSHELTEIFSFYSATMTLVKKKVVANSQNFICFFTPKFALGIFAPRCPELCVSPALSCILHVVTVTMLATQHVTQTAQRMYCNCWH